MLPMNIHNLDFTRWIYSNEKKRLNDLNSLFIAEICYNGKK